MYHKPFQFSSNPSAPQDYIGTLAVPELGVGAGEGPVIFFTWPQLKMEKDIC